MSQDNAEGQEQDQPVLWLRIREHNDWERETWYHYFMDEEGVEEALQPAVDSQRYLSGPDRVLLTWSAAEALAKEEPGYMNTHWFGRLRNFGVLQADTHDLYKGGIREFGEEMMEYVEESKPTLQGIGGTPYVENWAQDLEDEGLVSPEPIEEDE